MDQEHIIILKPALREAFRQSWAQCRIIFLSAPCGLGKTAAARELLAGKSVCAFSAMDPEFLEDPMPTNWDAMVVDDLHLLRDPGYQRTLCDWLRAVPDRHFVFLSRGPVPGWLMPFQFTGLLTTIETPEFRLDRATLAAVLAENGFTVADGDLTVILHDTQGYPAAVTALLRHLGDGEPYTPAVYEAMRQDLYHYLEDAVFLRFPMPMRRLLLALAPFDRFDAELAQLVSGDSHVNELLTVILHETSMLASTGDEGYRFWSVFRDFLLWELQQAYTPAEQTTVYSRAGLYYELHQDYAHALDCYTRCGDSGKVSELLEKSADQHPGLGHYYEMARFYYALPEEEVRRSVSLMSALSMLNAMEMDYDASERWYNALQDYTANLKRTDAEYAKARGRLAYLDIALPQRGSQGLVDVITGVFKVLNEKELTLPAFSVTSTLPSIMNGGKDFCEWSRRDELLARTMRAPLEAVLGRDGVGLVECAICESQFEKGADVSDRMMALLAKLPDIQRTGTPDIVFAATGLLARVQAAQGSISTALNLLEELRQTFVDTGQTRFLPNLDAMRVRLWLRMGRLDEAERWRQQQAPAVSARLRTMWRYQYMTRVMTELQRGDYPAALLLASMLLTYCQRCGRVMDALHLRVLSAIALHRRQDPKWRQELTEGLRLAREYGFVRPVGQYGAAVLPLLTACGWRGDKSWFDRVVAETRRQAVHYPNFLRPQPTLIEPLSPAELQVLRLVCHDRSNQEIADILGIKVATVKTHVVHILQKLGVNRRGEAKTAAQAMHLVQLE